ncbi:MAG: hypothetical protein NZM40_07045 [Sphingomonadaceae bacterium]|uniref:hypothetical protein n=1 Tax=Thermaurantiacus sp. TaxID=2820283 RepID=UPI00298F1AB9|nr:hypothetical protein [Thermaurantiacus sp.]MCS6987171.1 hypothetical protein [Sphingomonadaceae bacterium]MDW8415795.1 hypothetical protein [Thermaurantiacus sp.]
MNTLRLLLAVAVTAALTVFALANWQTVEVYVWPETIVALPLALLILAILAVVWVPMMIWLRAQRLILKARIARLEGQLADTEGRLQQARVELLRPPAAPNPAPPLPHAIPQALPPPGT